MLGTTNNRSDSSLAVLVHNKDDILTMVIDHSILLAMEQIAISKFKATCLSVLEKVRRTRKPILVTRFGKAVAEVIPPPPAPRPEHWLGALESTGKIKGDIISPATDEQDWEVLRP